MGMCIFVVSSGTVYYVFGVFLGPIIEDMGWTRGSTSIAFSIFTVMNGGSGPFVATLIERFGVRRTMLMGQCLLVAGLLLLSRVTQLWHLHLLYGLLLGFGLGSTSYVSMTTLLNTWFVRRRSLAIGMAMAGSGLGTVLMAPLVRYLIEVIGWRNTWMVLAAVAFTFALVPTFLLARNSPQEMGLQPEGEPSSPPGRPGRRARRVAYSTSVDWEASTAFKTPTLWLIVFMAFANTFALSMMTSHQVVHLEDVGIAPVVAAGALGLMVAASAVGRLLGGAAGQWFQLRYVAAIASTMQVIGLAMLLLAKSLPMVYAYVFLFGPAYGTMVILFPSIVAAYFGRRGYPRIFGTVFAVISLLSAGSPVMAGYVFDATGSYLLPFSLSAAFCAVAAVAVLLARPPVLRTKVPQEVSDN